MKKLATVLLVVTPIVGISEPSPFGMEIGKMTTQQLQSSFDEKYTGINKYSNGKMYDINVSSLNFQGLKSVTTIFDNKGKLVAVLTSLSKNKFDYLLSSLSKKYKFISKKTPFVGNKSAKFIDDNTDITLDAPHLSFTMQMNYIHQDLIKKFKSESEKEKRSKESVEQSKL